MCGRYTLRDPDAVSEAIHFLGCDPRGALPRRYNVAPSQSMPVVRPSPGGPAVAMMHWGFVPFFARGAEKPIQVFNARTETAAEKPTFRRAIQARRCLVPADGFFEWKRDGAQKVPYFIRRRGEAPFFMAGLFEEEGDGFPGGYALLTTGPNALMAKIHDRMPVILAPDQARAWLQEGTLTADEVRARCVPYPPEDMVADPVSPIVNHARNDVPECVAPRPAP
jgi:putative SOS response-associated peptidase YedK